MSIGVNTLASKMQLIIKEFDARKLTKDITDNSSCKYSRSIIKQVHQKEDGHDTQRDNSRTVLVNMSSIGNNRAKQSYTRLAWLMFHKISQMYRDIRDQEREEAT